MDQEQYDKIRASINRRGGSTVTGTLPISAVAGDVSIRDATNAQNGAVTATQIQALESASAAQHAAVTVSAPIILTGQALELKNNAGSPAQVTAIDVGALATDSDTVIPTSKAVATYASAAVSAAHTRSHAIDGTSDHSMGSVSSGYLLKSDGTKIANATNTDTEVAAAVSSVIMRNRQETNANDTLASGYNGTVLGPWTVGNGYTFTITDGSRFMVLND